MDLMTYLLATKNGGGGSGLPEVTSADNGKILKVKDGEWGTGEDISGDKLPPVSSTDNGKVLKVVDAEWNIGEDEGGIEAVELTQGQYNELSTAEKEDPTKVYFINTGTPTLDPQYAYHTNQDETLIYRCKADDGSEGMWFLNGFEVTSLTNTAIPTELRQYAPGGNGKVSDAWADTNGTPFLVGGKQCYAGIYNNTVRIWSNNGTTNQLGTVYAVIDMRLDNRQYNEWSDPYIYTTNRNHKIYYKDIKYSVSIPDSTIFNNGKILRIVNGAWSIDDETTELPEVTGSDNGKILKVTEGQWAKGDAPTELPSVSSSDNGKILKVADGQWTKGDAPSELPEVTAADEGKILEVNSSGEWDKGDIPESYVSLTQAQYDALPSSKLTDGKMYCITDQDARELPEVTASDNGKILKVDNGAWTKGDAPTELPATTSADEGKVLKVGSNGNWEKATDTAATTVKQSPTITNADYEILFSGTADNTEHAEIVRKTTSFIFNPNIRTAFIGIKATGDWIPGSYSFGTGYFIKISGDYSHAEGYQTIASGNYSHAEGNSVTASGNHSHAEGFHTTVDGDFSHGEGYYTTASGAYGSHAEGYHTIASGNYSHAEGQYTTANHKSQHTFGEFNILDDSQAASTARGNYIEIVGNGNADVRSNARTLDWSGNEWIAGTYTNGSSRKIKTNIESLTNTEALKILDLNPVKFDFIKTGTNDQRERGFIAEEVMNVIPQIAFEEETDNEGNITKPASLNYIGLIPYLVKMIQIQQQEIDKLKEQINN